MDTAPALDGTAATDGAAVTTDDPQHTPTVVVVDKVKIHFVAVGSAPILQRTKFQMPADQRFAAVHVFLRQRLKLGTPASSSESGSVPSSQNLFLYCHAAFCPAPDQLIGELRDAFAVRDELVIHYSLQEAWG
jgi:ubiquitin-like protein ATG12